MTERLYYKDSHMSEFSAEVISCEKKEDFYEIILDATAFFPEGGGQNADTGFIDDAEITYVFERDSDVIHIANKPLIPGSKVSGRINWEERFRLMQGHTGEHILSGTIHKMYGFDNVGFHMGADGIIVDFSGYLTKEQLREIEFKVNEKITANLPVTQSFPSAEELKKLEYRSKLDLTENVRLVTIEDTDVCACCAPHVKRTGEVGMIKLLDSIKRKDGVRIRMLAGMDALKDYIKKSDTVSEISTMLSAKESDVTSAVERVQKEKAGLEWHIGALTREIVKMIADSTAPTERDLVFFRKYFSSDDMRLLVNALTVKCSGICAVFSEKDGGGYTYVMGSSTKDMREEAKKFNSKLNGRGGGTREMISGSVMAAREDIEKFFDAGNM